MSIVEINVAPGISLYHIGPPLDLGPMPSLFYFALSGPDSLGLDPFNQPVQFLHGKMIRIFSMTLPGHENGLPATEAIQIWADDPSAIETFLENFDTALAFAIKNQFVNPNKIAAAGLSRGGFIALQVAMHQDKIGSVLGFAPVTDLSLLKEFRGKQDPYPLEPKRLIHKSIKFFIGNADTRVGTKTCFQFANAIVETSQIRSPKVEFTMYPSIGHHGHGTPPEIFKQGAEWISTQLL